MDKGYIARNFRVGDRVHIDTDNEEWGRVCSDGEILSLEKDGQCLVNAEHILADIFVPVEDIGVRYPCVGTCPKHGEYFMDAEDSPCPSCEDE